MDRSLVDSHRGTGIVDLSDDPLAPGCSIYYHKIALRHRAQQTGLFRMAIGHQCQVSFSGYLLLLQVAQKLFQRFASTKTLPTGNDARTQHSEYGQQDQQLIGCVRAFWRAPRKIRVALYTDPAAGYSPPTPQRWPVAPAGVRTAQVPAMLPG